MMAWRGHWQQQRERQQQQLTGRQQEQMVAVGLLFSSSKPAEAAQQASACQAWGSWRQGRQGMTRHHMLAMQRGHLLLQRLLLLTLKGPAVSLLMAIVTAC
jgi:hypothetical protein